MTVKINYTENVRQVPVPQNRGLARFVNARIGEVVTQFNAKLAESVKTNGVEVRIWQRNFRGSLPCTCTYHNKSPHRFNSASRDLVANDANDTLTGITLNNPTKFELEDPEQTDAFSPESFIVRGAGFQPGTIFDNTGKKSHPVKAGETHFDSTFDNPQLDDYSAVPVEADISIDLAKISNLITGNDRTSCGICLGTGFIDGYTFVSGQRLILDASTNSNFSLEGVEIDSTVYPHQFRAVNTAQMIVWNVTFPRWFTKCVVIRPLANREITQEWVVEIFFASQWQTFTPELCNTLIGHTNTNLQIRAHPIISDLERVALLTHVEITLEMVELPLAQLPQQLKATAFDTIDYYTSDQFVLDPKLPPLNRESIIHDLPSGDLWKITEVKNNITGTGKMFGTEITCRKVQIVEQVMLLRYSRDSTPQEYTSYRGGTELVQGGREDLAPLLNYQTPNIEAKE